MKPSARWLSLAAAGVGLGFHFLLQGVNAWYTALGGLKYLPSFVFKGVVPHIVWLTGGSSLAYGRIAFEGFALATVSVFLFRARGGVWMSLWQTLTLFCAPLVAVPIALMGLGNPPVMNSHVTNFLPFVPNWFVLVVTLALSAAGVGSLLLHRKLPALPSLKALAPVLVVGLFAFGTMSSLVLFTPAYVSPIKPYSPSSYSGGHGENHDNPPVGNVTLWNGIINCTLPSGFSYSTNITLSEHDYLLYGANDTKMACLNGNATAIWRKLG